MENDGVRWRMIEQRGKKSRRPGKGTKSPLSSGNQADGRGTGSLNLSRETKVVFVQLITKRVVNHYMLKVQYLACCGR